MLRAENLEATANTTPACKQRRTTLRGRGSVLGTATRTTVLPDSLLLETSETTRRNAAYATIICVFCDALNLQCCAPNYPMMVTPGHTDSFPSIQPFDIASAQYVLSGATQFAVVLSNLAFGYLSGKIGTRLVKATLL